MKIALFFNVFRHLKRGSAYRRLTLDFEVQSSRPIVEGDVLSCYISSDGKGWARLKSEFDDGRFEPSVSVLKWYGSGESVADSMFGQYRISYLGTGYSYFTILEGVGTLAGSKGLSDAQYAAQKDYEERLSNERL